MGNMSYCRFENTLNDMVDCLRALEEEGMDTLESRSELEAAEDLMLTAKKFIRVYEEAKTWARHDESVG